MKCRYCSADFKTNREANAHEAECGSASELNGWLASSSASCDTAIMRLHVKMFITFLQTKNIYPCRLLLAEENPPVEVDELMALVDEFTKLAS